GELECSDLIEWINKGKKADSRKRVIQVLTDIKLFQSVTEPKASSLQSLDVRGRTIMARNLLAKDKHHLQQCLDSFRSINEILRGYRVYPQLARPTEYGWDLEWEPVFGRNLPRTSGSIFDEGRRMLQLVHLAKDGFLARVNSCPCCSNWFFARFRHQK